MDEERGVAGREMKGGTGEEVGEVEEKGERFIIITITSFIIIIIIIQWSIAAMQMQSICHHHTQPFGSNRHSSKHIHIHGRVHPSHRVHGITTMSPPTGRLPFRDSHTDRPTVTRNPSPRSAGHRSAEPGGTTVCIKTPVAVAAAAACLVPHAAALV